MVIGKILNTLILMRFMHRVLRKVGPSSSGTLPESIVFIPMDNGSNVVIGYGSHKEMAYGMAYDARRMVNKNACEAVKVSDYEYSYTMAGFYGNRGVKIAEKTLRAIPFDDDPLGVLPGLSKKYGINEDMVARICREAILVDGGEGGCQ